MTYKYLKLLGIVLVNLQSSNYVAWHPPSGRLGDHLICYMHAKWISYKYNFTLLCMEFPYSDKFVFHDVELNIARFKNKFSKEKKLRVGQSLDNFIDLTEKDVLYRIPYFPESLEEFLSSDIANCAVTSWVRPKSKLPYFEVDWKDLKFKQILQNMIKPNYPINLIKVPSNVVTIAIHVRKNSNGFDLPLLHGRQKYDKNQVYVDVVFPLKHPPEDYYIEQLQMLLNIISTQKKIYVYIFTDDANPEVIVDNFRKGIVGYDVEFDFNKSNNNHYTNVLEDLFGMTQFDYFIRPDSNLSIVASKIGNFKMVISPAHHHWEGTKLVIDAVNIDSI